MLLRIGSALQLKHDPEKWPPVFGQDHAQRTSMIPKSGHRFSDKIMLKEQARARKTGPGFPKRLCCHNEVTHKPIRPIVLSLIISLSCEVCRILAPSQILPPSHSGKGKEANNAGL
jgi:hypothetical protein